MAEASPKRPTRRAAARRKMIADESDEENLVLKGREEEEEFTPAPQRSPRRQTRRKTVEPPSTPQTSAKTHPSRINENAVPSQILQPAESLQIPESPTKRSSPRKRKSAPAPRKARGLSAVGEPLGPPLPVIKDEENASPLGDITHKALNEQVGTTNGPKDFVVVKAMDTIMEKPMDIVVRSRALPTPVVQEDSGPKARTVIRNLVLLNFKSYAGRQEVGPFHASFSSVVGPNGSGKSNVIDSLLFVFGFRASKMRQGKVSALIHNSAGHPDLDYCEVEVHFQEVMDQVSIKVERESPG